MKKKTKRFTKVIAVFMAVLLLLGCSGCSKDEGVYSPPDISQSDMTYDQFFAAASPVLIGNTYVLDNGDQIKIESVKAKSMVVSPLAAVFSVIITLVSLVAGGVISIPGFVPASKGMKIVQITLTYTNRSPEKVSLLNTFCYGFARYGDSIYASQFYAPKGGNLRAPASVSVKPGDSVKVYIAFEIPKEIVKSGSTVTLAFSASENIYSYDFRK